MIYERFDFWAIGQNFLKKENCLYRKYFDTQNENIFLVFCLKNQNPFDFDLTNPLNPKYVVACAHIACSKNQSAVILESCYTLYPQFT